MIKTRSEEFGVYVGTYEKYNSGSLKGECGIAVFDSIED
jgi:hypothetical protein